MAGGKSTARNTCPLIKASVGARLDGTCPFKIADMYIGETTCDEKKSLGNFQQEVPYVMDIPQMKWKGYPRLERGNKVTLKNKFTGNKAPRF